MYVQKFHTNSVARATRMAWSWRARRAGDGRRADRIDAASELGRPRLVPVGLGVCGFESSQSCVLSPIVLLILLYSAATPRPQVLLVPLRGRHPLGERRADVREAVPGHGPGLEQVARGLRLPRGLRPRLQGAARAPPPTVEHEGKGEKKACTLQG